MIMCHFYVYRLLSWTIKNIYYVLFHYIFLVCKGLSGLTGLSSSFDSLIAVSDHCGIILNLTIQHSHAHHSMISLLYGGKKRDLCPFST